MMDIYILRHGQAENNINGKYGGRTDDELTQIGLKEAYSAKEKLSYLQFDKVYSSPLKRAYNTAKIITDEPIIIDERLIERSNGSLEGRLKSEIKDKINFNDPNENKYGIENVNHLKTRIKSFFDELTETFEGKNVLIVTHAGFIMYARGYFEGDPPNEDYQIYKIGNCEIIKYSYDKKTKVYKKC